MLITSIVLLGTASIAVGLLAKHGPDDRKPTGNSCAAPPAEVNVLDQIAALSRQARAVAEKYVAAITARDEPAAAQFTYRKKDGSLLWVSAAGRKITIVDVSIGGPYADGVASASVTIQVEIQPPTAIVLILKDGEWSVWP